MKGDTIFCSIIVPVYNTGKYLEKCLYSLSHQTLKEIEIICINDASSDNSSQILATAQTNDKRIKIINLEQNRGGGYARNRGMEVAIGKYIGFVDSDDYIDLDYFEKLYKTAEENACDIAVTSILKHKEIRKKYNVLYKKQQKVFDIQDKIQLCGDVKHFFFYAWNKLYRSDCLKKQNIKFAEGQIYEDVIFAIKSLYYSNSLISVPTTEYHYILHKTSVTKSIDKTGKKQQDMAKAYKQLQEFCKEKNIKLPERLNYHTTFWHSIFIKTYVGLYKTKKMLFGIIPIRTIDTSKNKKHK